MSKKILITGASGFVGYHLIDIALSKGLEVYAAVRKSSNISHLKGLNVNFVELNFNKIDDLIALLNHNKFEYIVHAAGSTKAKTLLDYKLVNADYSNNLAIAASKVDYNLEKFIFVSSLAALGPIDDFNSLIQDNSVANPLTMYGKSKLIAEDFLNQISNLPLITVRPTAVYGPREKDIFILFKTINQGLEPYIGSFRQQLSFIYVRDLAEVILRFLSTDIINKTYNITDGLIYDRYALAEELKSSLHKKTLKFHLPISLISGVAGIMEFLYSKSSQPPTVNREKVKELSAPNWACNIENLITDLNFTPQFNLEKGVIETVNWYKSNHWLK